MNHRAQYIFVALAVLTGITIAVSVAFFFLLVPKEVPTAGGNTPRWAEALFLFALDVAGNALVCVSALVTSGWMKENAFVSRFFGGLNKTYLSLHPSLSQTATGRVGRRGGRRRAAKAAKASIPDPYMRRLGFYGNLMLMISLLILYLICSIVAEYRHPEQSWSLFALPVVVFFIAEVACVEKLTERRIQRDNQ